MPVPNSRRQDLAIMLAHQGLEAIIQVIASERHDPIVLNELLRISQWLETSYLLGKKYRE